MTTNGKKLNADETVCISGITLTHANRFFESTGAVTKKILAEYYDAVSDLILPHIINRPLVLYRCPDTLKKSCFFQKHYNKSFPDQIWPLKIDEKKEKTDYIMIKNKKGLISLVQLSCLEIHVWGSSCTNIEKPDHVTFDLDPAPEVPWKMVVKAAFLLRDILEQLNLVSYLKTSGGKGLHIVVPIRRDLPWKRVKNFSHALASYLSQAYPDSYTDNPLLSQRKGKIFIDYLRNTKGATTVAVYSMRAKNNGPISTPISWNELPRLKSSGHYTIFNILKRLSNQSVDPWEGYFLCHQRLPKMSGWE